MAAARFRFPALVLAGLSVGLNLAIIGCAGRTINVFQTEHKTNVWLLPVWSNHFDTRELHALVGTSATITVLNAILMLALFVQRLPANLIVLITSLLGTFCSIIAVAFPAVLNQKAPARDTLQTWTCMWTNAIIDEGSGKPPAQFNTICRETRFAFWATLPVLIIQLLLLSTAVYAIATGTGHGSGNGPARLMSDAEKGVSQHELKQVPRAQSFETTHSDGSPKSQQEAQMGRKAVGFA